MTQPRTKISQLREAAASDDWVKAMSIAAKFPRLGDEKEAILRAHECLTGNADFHRQLGKDPDQLIADGIDALKSKYKLGDEKMSVATAETATKKTRRATVARKPRKPTAKKAAKVIAGEAPSKDELRAELAGKADEIKAKLAESKAKAAKKKPPKTETVAERIEKNDQHIKLTTADLRDFWKRTSKGTWEADRAGVHLTLKIWTEDGKSRNWAEIRGPLGKVDAEDASFTKALRAAEAAYNAL